ncbi:hypothetical protein [Aeoliella sp.]|uniref:hypothetical protein n=1 Tax=Aeoliella sp. TaxID=2795800 RepID=UPI003CCB7838
MKCPECGHDQKHKYGMTCSCGYQFTLDPKQDKISDGKFLALVRNASSNDTYYFTKNQLVAAYCRREVKGRMGGVVVVAIIGLVMSCVAWFGIRPEVDVVWIFLLAAGLLILFGGTWAVLQWRPNQARMESAIDKWLAEGKPIPRLLLHPSLQEPPPEWDEPDIYDYGVESILIVEHDLLVDLLVKNGFHASQRCLIVSETGYPGYIASRITELLHERPDLPIYLLHDSTRKGERMIERIDQQLRLPHHREFIDLGLFLEDVKRIKRLRPMLSARDDYAIALDYIGYGMLVGGLSQALDEQLTLAAVLDAQAAGGYEASSFG